MEITCSNCGRILANASIDVGSAIARCPDCRYSFHFSKGGKPRTKRETKRLWRIKVKRVGTDIVVTRIWFSPLSFLFIVFFTLPITLLAYIVFFIVVNPHLNTVIRLGALLPLILWTILIYFTLCLIFNRTRFIVTSKKLRISHFPLPWRRSGLQIDKSDIEQIFVKFRNESSLDDSGRTEFFRCLVKTKSGNEIIIASGLSFDEARSIESELEKALEIKDNAVKDEFILIPDDLQAKFKKLMRLK